MLADADLMVRAVDPSNPRLNGRVFDVDDGKVQALAPVISPASGSTTPAGMASASAVAASGVDYEATTLRLEAAARRTRSP